jgi:hypothetical protein
MPRIIKPAKGSFTTADLTIDSDGRVIAASSGSVSATNMVLTQSIHAGTNPTTFTAQPGTSKLHVYIRGGGGGGGGASGAPALGGVGGHGGYGFFKVPVTQPYTAPFSIGEGGGGGNTNPQQAGQAGSATTFNTNLTANGGNGGAQANPTPQGGTNMGTPGTVSNETYAYTQPATAEFPPFFFSGHIMMDDVGGQNDGGTFFTGAQIQNASNLPQAGGLIPGLYNQKASKLRQAGQGGDGGLDGAKPGGPQNGQSGNDGGILIYEDIG